MSWSNRLRFGAGVLAVLLVAGLGIVVFNQRQHRVDSLSASIAAVEHQVGTDYSGIVVQVDVKLGDTVAVGDPLMVISSAALEHDVADGLVSADRVGVDPDGFLTVYASVDGVVTDLEVGAGGYAWQGAPVATISERDTLYIEADYLVSTIDFGRIDDVARVDIRLPDSTVLEGYVQAMDVERAGTESLVTLEIVSADLDWGAVAGLVEPGTPVLATLGLRDDGVLAGTGDMLSTLVHRIGL